MWLHTFLAVVVLYLEIGYWTSRSRFGATAQPSSSRDHWTSERKIQFRWVHV